MASGLKPRSSESNELKTETKHQYLKTGVSEITVEKDDFIVLIMTSWGKKGTCERDDACHPHCPSGQALSFASGYHRGDKRSPTGQRGTCPQALG